MNVIALKRLFLFIVLSSLTFLIGCAGLEFAEAKLMKDKAYDVYMSCKTEEAKKIAREATKMAKALCPAHPKPISMMPSDKVIDKFILTINFDFNKSKIRNKDKEQLKQAIDFVKKYKGYKIKLEGHTDWIGTEKYNQGLSERRAEATKKYLIKKGSVTEQRISSVGYGELKPVASNKTRDGRAKNRRVEILILAD